MEFNAYLPPNQIHVCISGTEKSKDFLEQTVLRRVGETVTERCCLKESPFSVLIFCLFVLLAKLALTAGTLFPWYLLSTYCRPGTWLQIFMSHNNHDSSVLYFSVSRKTSKCVQKFTSRSDYSNELRHNSLKVKSLQLSLKLLTGLRKLKFPNFSVRQK